jgi:hypothetical protein
MSEPTPFCLSRLFSQLVGRKVTFTQTTAAVDSKIRQMYGIYTVFPNQTAIVVKSDLSLFASLAGILVGLPDSAVKEHLVFDPVEEFLRDAIYEVFNIASAAVTAGDRAVFTKMVTEPSYIDGAAGNVFKKPSRRSYFNVSVDGYQGGKFTVLS